MSDEVIQVRLWLAWPDGNGEEAREVSAVTSRDAAIEFVAQHERNRREYPVLGGASTLDVWVEPANRSPGAPPAGCMWRVESKTAPSYDARPVNRNTKSAEGGEKCARKN